MGIVLKLHISSHQQWHISSVASGIQQRDTSILPMKLTKTDSDWSESFGKRQEEIISCLTSSKEKVNC